MSKHVLRPFAVPREKARMRRHGAGAGAVRPAGGLHLGELTLVQERAVLPREDGRQAQGPPVLLGWDLHSACSLTVCLVLLWRREGHSQLCIKLAEAWQSDTCNGVEYTRK